MKETVLWIQTGSQRFYRMQAGFLKAAVESVDCVPKTADSWNLDPRIAAGLLHAIVASVLKESLPKGGALLLEQDDFRYLFFQGPEAPLVVGLTEKDEDLEDLWSQCGSPQNCGCPLLVFADVCQCLESLKQQWGGSVHDARSLIPDWIMGIERFEDCALRVFAIAQLLPEWQTGWHLYPKGIARALLFVGVCIGLLATLDTLWFPHSQPIRLPQRMSSLQPTKTATEAQVPPKGLSTNPEAVTVDAPSPDPNPRIGGCPLDYLEMQGSHCAIVLACDQRVHWCRSQDLGPWILDETHPGFLVLRSSRGRTVLRRTVAAEPSEAVSMGPEGRLVALQSIPRLGLETGDPVVSILQWTPKDTADEETVNRLIQTRFQFNRAKSTPP